MMASVLFAVSGWWLYDRYHQNEFGLSPKEMRVIVRAIERQVPAVKEVTIFASVDRNGTGRLSICGMVRSDVFALDGRLNGLPASSRLFDLLFDTQFGFVVQAMIAEDQFPHYVHEIECQKLRELQRQRMTS